MFQLRDPMAPLIRDMLSLDPEQRLAAKEALDAAAVLGYDKWTEHIGLAESSWLPLTSNTDLESQNLIPTSPLAGTQSEASTVIKGQPIVHTLGLSRWISARPNFCDNRALEDLEARRHTDRRRNRSTGRGPSSALRQAKARQFRM